ncbi:CusA/CzcA family heavy metal efflux RND transporter [Halorhodospira abdelmalekii]|uniref:efflux RND transporter permease subunit n=1 Tax=Halorhodospira abdelmalekii TaxID=421629 RepID=UPI001908FC6B|nr:CusA/CzcA family heavy metal efflux RND transporter [Halorhodospira abdelmalekii]MBK1734571.1 CusA/CzcA family heavy metal efflux RND transporter [Halorhodospira abdelmalekii]
MIDRIIQWSIENRLLVLLLTAVIVAWGVFSVRHTPLDAIPDLSDTQVIVHTAFPGQAPEVVEDQVTYPLATALLAVPGAQDVRGFSMFGDSYVYVLFDDDVNLYWARARVLEYLSQVAPDLPAGANPALGPDATGVGWIYKYALKDTSGKHDLGQLRALQDWFLRFELQSIDGIAEVAPLGGMVKQYQVELDPEAVRAYGLSLGDVADRIRAANREVGGSVVEMAEAEYMVRAKGYLSGLSDLADIPLGIQHDGAPVLLEHVAEIRERPRMRRGIAELDGQGEVVGAILVMRDGENALTTIRQVKERLEELQRSLPDGVEIVEVYDRSELIEGSVANLINKLWQEFLIITAVVIVFLFHIRSALVALISLPIGILVALMIMNAQGISANIMSLGGIAVTIGAMVDAAIVMVENAHKRLERAPPHADRWKIIGRAAKEAGRPLFFALLVITISFLPLFALGGESGRLFAPLAFTGTYAMAAAAGLAVTLVPVLMGYLIRGRIRSEHEHPIARLLTALYRPVIGVILRHPWATLVLAVSVGATAYYPASQLGSEFMPRMDEGDLMYMPTLDPGLSVGKAREVLQQTNRLIMEVPEVEQVFGKAGRAESATDPAPLGMFESVIRFKPESQWREGMTKEQLIRELDRAVDLPGVANVWVPPIRTRIDMLATGVRAPVGIQISGADLEVIEAIGRDIEAAVAQIEGTTSVRADRTATGRYLEIEIDRREAARYGLSVDEIQSVIRFGVGGMEVSQMVEGVERFPISLRYPQERRSSPEALEALPLVAPNGEHLALGDVAAIAIVDGPAMIRTENARRTGTVNVDIADRALGGYIAEARQVVRDEVDLPPGYSIRFVGQYEQLESTQEQLQLFVPLTLALIFVLLYLCFRNWVEPLMLLATLPFALVGGLWLSYGLGFDLSVATAVGFILLGGLAIEFAVVLLAYLHQAVAEHAPKDRAELIAAISEGAVRRVRPLTMTAMTIILALLPLLIDTGLGSEAMQRIAAPMIGGMVTAPIIAFAIVPVLYYLWQRRHYPEPAGPVQ